MTPYISPRDCTDTANCVNYMKTNIDNALARIPASKRIVLEMMAFDRETDDGSNPATREWAHDIPTLAALQDATYDRAYNNPRVLALLMFAYSRGNGAQKATDRIPEIKARHMAQGAQLMRWAAVIDTPGNGTTVTQPFSFGGWATDLAALSGSGVDFIHLYAYLNGSPTFIGQASTIPGSRPDVAAFLGDSRFAGSGYGLVVGGLGARTYTFVAYAHSTADGSFTPRVVTVNTTTLPPMLNIDVPGPGNVSSPFLIGGWAVDPRSPTGTGVATVHVYAHPASGAAPIFIPGSYGGDRPDVAAYVGSPRFTPCGFGAVASLAPGTYTIVAYALSTETGTFSIVQTVTVTVS